MEILHKTNVKGWKNLSESARGAVEEVDDILITSICGVKC